MKGFAKAKENIDSNVNHISNKASHLVHEGKKLAEDLYEDGIKKIDVAQKNAEEFSDELLEHVRENPLKSVLISAGIGFLLSALLKK